MSNFPQHRHFYGGAHKPQDQVEFFWKLYHQHRAARSSLKFESEASVFAAQVGEDLTDLEVAELAESHQAVTVERSGQGGEVLPLESFEELKGLIPDCVFENIVQRMGYTTPTPIQRHSLPLGLRRYDLMYAKTHMLLIKLQ